MKLLEQLFKAVAPYFAEGKPLALAHPLFEATESFFLSTGKTAARAPHVRDAADVKRIMSMVIFALIPCTLFGIYNTGFQSIAAAGRLGGASHLDIFIAGLWLALPLIVVSYAVGGFWEVLFAIVRRHEINEGFLVTGLLFPLILPPTLPLWQAAVGISFGVVFGKEVFGGTGMNIFNPALVARCFVFFAYPGQMSGDIWTYLEPGAKMIDGFSAATALSVASGVGVGGSPIQALAGAGYSFEKLFFGFVPGCIGETSTLMCLLGAVILVASRVAAWQTMVATLLGGLCMSLVLNALAYKAALGGAPINGYWGLAPHWHLAMGGFAFGTVFMATDPVSSPSSITGKWIYGFLIGFLAIFIRALNPAYPEGMMLAILFMNLWAPLIDILVVKAAIRRRRERYVAR